MMRGLLACVGVLLLAAGGAYALGVSVPLSITIEPTQTVGTTLLLNGGTTGLFPAPAVFLDSPSQVVPTVWTVPLEAGTLTASCGSGPCAVSGYALSTTAPNCSTTNGADNGSFAIDTTPPNAAVVAAGVTPTGSALVVGSAGLAIGTYHVCVAATVNGSMVGAPFVVTGMAHPNPSTDGAVASGPNSIINTIYENGTNANSISLFPAPQKVAITNILNSNGCGWNVYVNDNTGTAPVATAVAVENYNNLIYTYSGCGTLFGGPWFKSNRVTHGWDAAGNNAPQEAGIPSQPIWITYSAPTCTNPITVPCWTKTGGFQIPDNTKNGTVLATATIATSDGAPFAGTLTAPPGPLGVSAYNIVATRDFAPGDDNMTFTAAVKAIPVVQPQISSVGLAPLTFMTQAGNAGSNVGLITTAMANKWGVAQPSYTLVTTCGPPCADSALFTISGNELFVGAADITTARSYAITIADNEDASNSGLTQSFTLAGVPNTGTAACPSLAPPAAQRAGLTTLAYCGDFSQPKYATLTNWLYCLYGTQGLIPFEWEVGGSFCDAQHFFQDTDPTTGNKVMHIIWPSTGDPHAGYWSMNSTSSPFAPDPNTGYGQDLPAANYVELRARFNEGAFTSGNSPSPDWFLWNQCGPGSPHHQLCGGSQNQWWQGWGPVEIDFFELYGLQTIGGGGNTLTTHVWSPIGGTINPTPYWAANVGGHGNYIPLTTPSWSRQTQHTYGALTSWTGNMSNPGYNLCMYVDNVKTANDGFSENCQYRDYLTNSGFLYADQNQMVNRHFAALWIGGYLGAQQDAYIEAIRFWTCANWKTDNTCSGNGIAQ